VEVDCVAAWGLGCGSTDALSQAPPVQGWVVNWRYGKGKEVTGSVLHIIPKTSHYKVLQGTKDIKGVQG